MICHQRGSCEGRKLLARTVKDEELCQRLCQDTKHCKYTTFQGFNRVCKLHIECKYLEPTWHEIFVNMRDCPLVQPQTTTKSPTTTTTLITTSTTTTSTTTASTTTASTTTASTTTVSTTTERTTTTTTIKANNKLFFVDGSNGTVTLG